MSGMIDDKIVQAVLVTLAVVAILGLFGWLKFRRDEKIVMEFLKEFGVETRDDPATTTVISAATRLSETRIRKVCNKSARIRRHREDTESWKLH